MSVVEAVNLVHPFDFLRQVAYGDAFAARGVALGAFAANTFPGREVGAIYGWITSGQLIGGAIGPWPGGLAFDQLGSYRLVFYGCIACFTLSALLIGVATHGSSHRELRPASQDL